MNGGNGVLSNDTGIVNDAQTPHQEQHQQQQQQQLHQPSAVVPSQDDTEKGPGSSGSKTESTRTLQEVCADINGRVERFLSAPAEDKVVQRTQEQTRVASSVIAQALDDYDFESLSLSYNGGKDCLVMLILYLSVLHTHFTQPSGRRKQKQIDGDDDGAFPTSIPSIYAKPPDPFDAVTDFVETSTRDYHLDLTHVLTNPGTKPNARSHSSPPPTSGYQTPVAAAAAVAATTAAAVAAAAAASTTAPNSSILISNTDSKVEPNGDITGQDPHVPIGSESSTTTNVVKQPPQQPPPSTSSKSSHFPQSSSSNTVSTPVPARTTESNSKSESETVSKPIISFRDAFALYLHNHPTIRAICVGTRRTDPHGATLDHFQMTDGNWPRFMRVHPVIDWRLSEIWCFLRSDHLADPRTGRKLPYCEMYDRGYTSLGGVADTLRNPRLRVVVDDADGTISTTTYRPAYEMTEDEDERAGRE